MTDGIKKYPTRSIIGFPAFTKLLRSLEKSYVGFLESLGGEEILLPKLIEEGECKKLEGLDPRFVNEWPYEQFKVYDHTGSLIGRLAHWQCEPVYHHAESIFSTVKTVERRKLIFDRSGYSYRREKSKSIYAPVEFLRVEAFMLGEVQALDHALEEILLFSQKLLPEYETKIIEKPEESFGGREKVRDLVVYIDGKEIEILGTHQHFKTFAPLIEKGQQDFEPMYQASACCGFSLTRSALLKFGKNPDETWI